MPVTMLEAAFGTVAALVVPALAVGLHAPPGRSVPVAATVEIGERIVDFPAPGEFLSGGVPAAAPSKPIMVAGFRMMTRQVSLAEYDLCVAAGACMARRARFSGRRSGHRGQLDGCRHICSLVFRGHWRILAASDRARGSRGGRRTFWWRILLRNGGRPPKSRGALDTAIQGGSRGQAPRGSRAEARRPLRAQHSRHRGFRRQRLGMDFELLQPRHARCQERPARDRRRELRRARARGTAPGLHVQFRSRRQEWRMRRRHAAGETGISTCSR